jgi:hypothetical protein
MGTVYLALDRKHGRRVALKILPPDLAAALGPERFLREIQIAAQLNHPHILPLYDSGQAAGFLYYVMPFVDGESLRQRLAREQRLPVTQALEIARQVADALSHAHGTGVIHRDVKPENILLAGGHALLADFGVAKALARSDPGARMDDLRTDSGLPIGTRAYASPEQAAGRRHLDGRTDIYSLGCVLYEMLVGEGDGAESSAAQALAHRFAVPPPTVQTVRADVPAWVGRALDRALAGNPADRWATAAEFRDALAGVAEAPALQTSPPRQPAVSPRRRVVWMAAGAAMLAIAGTAVAFLPRRTRVIDPKEVVVAGFENKTGDSALASVGDIAADYVARGLAATRLMHEVYDVRLLARELGESAGLGAPAGLALARRVGAGTVLWGSYYRDGDSLHFEAQLIDGATGKLIVPLEPAVGPVREKTRVVELLRQRVMAGFAVVLGSEFDTWKSASLPPTYEAYQEMLAGGQTGFDFAAAVEHYRRAAALDSNFTGAQTAAALMLWLGTDCAAVDSIARRLESKRKLLPPVDRGQLDLASASCAGDTDGALAAARAALDASPRSAEFTILGAVVALEHLRPHAGLEILRRVDPVKIGLKGFLLDVYMSWLGMTYHMLGDYRQELASGDSLSALAGLGRVDEAVRVALAALSEPHSDGDAWPTPMATVCGALELRAHGHPDAARQVLERVVAWYGNGGVNDATRDDFPCSGPHFSAFYYTGRWNQARAGYQHMLERDSTSVKAHAALGALAVRRGDNVEADRMDAWLARQTRSPVASYFRARMAALKGDRERAVALLHHALDIGLRGRMFLHLDPDFEALRDYPPYRELIRPDG